MFGARHLQPEFSEKNIEMFLRHREIRSHQADLALAVIGDGLVYGRPVRVLEVLVGGALVGLEVWVRGLAAADRKLKRELSP